MIQILIENLRYFIEFVSNAFKIFQLLFDVTQILSEIQSYVKEDSLHFGYRTKQIWLDKVHLEAKEKIVREKEILVFTF